MLFQGMDTPAWNIESEYPSFTSEPFLADYATVEKNLGLIEKKLQQLDLDRAGLPQVPTFQEILRLDFRLIVLLHILHASLTVSGKRSFDAATEASRQAPHTPTTQWRRRGGATAAPHPPSHRAVANTQTHARDHIK